ncbi:hypothetical protein PHLGIDRAFT_63177, partial [Phlebiopsis gigantea 11061_1 CR5-6]
WIAHFASGLVAKPFAPRVSLAVLAFAGPMPDALFFVLQFFGIESFNLAESIARQGGCFPYTNDYPLSHSLAGMLICDLIGVILAVLYKSFARVPASLTDMLAITATSTSHFLLEWPSHRHGKGHHTKITPGDNAAYGAGLFDYPLATFATENVIFFAGLWVYMTFAPAACKAGMQQHPSLLKIVSAVMVAQQAQFCVPSAPTRESRWVHAPLFLSLILGSCCLLGMLDGQTRSLGLQEPRSHEKEK